MMDLTKQLSTPTNLLWKLQITWICNRGHHRSSAVVLKSGAFFLLISVQRVPVEIHAVGLARTNTHFAGGHHQHNAWPNQSTQALQMEHTPTKDAPKS